MSVEAPERIWAASVTDSYGEWQTVKDGLPRPVEYVRADKLEGLAAENERLSERVETLESFRPHWAKGYSSDSMAAQAATAALSDIWKFLGVSNQTEAMSALAEKDKEIAALREDGR